MCIGLEVQTLKVSEMSEMENGVRSPRENGGRSPRENGERSPREDELVGRGDENSGHGDNDFDSSFGDLVTVPRVLLNKILKNTEENKKKAREAEIRARVSQIKQAAPRRAVSHLMKTLHLIEDAEAVWDDITQTAERNDIHIIRRDNAEKANDALERQGKLLEKVKKQQVMQ